jgi:hypothetical protein
MRFSQFTSDAPCNQKDAGDLEQRLDDEAEPVIAECEALILQDPGVGALDRPAPLAQPRSMRLTAFVDMRLSFERAAQLAMVLGVVALVRKHGLDPGQDAEGGQEQPLEDQGVVDVRRRGRAGDGDAVAGGRDVMLGAPLASIRRMGPVRSPPRLARTEQVSRIRVGSPRSMPTSTAWTWGSKPICAHCSRWRRKVEPLALSAVARRLRQGVPSRTNCCKVASTRTVADRGWPRPCSRGGAQKSMTVAMRFKSLTRRAAQQNPISSPMSDTPDMVISDR